MMVYMRRTQFKQVKIGEAAVTRLNLTTRYCHDPLGFWCEIDNTIRFYEMGEVRLFLSTMLVPRKSYK